MPRSGHWLLGLALLFLPFFAGALELTDLPGEPAATLRLPDLEGQVHDLADLRGRVVLVNLWASWCQPCIREIPRLRDLAAQFQDRPFALLAVNSGEPLPTVKRAVRRHGIDLQVLVDPSAGQTGAWGLLGLPTSYLVDAGGRTRIRLRGPLDDGDWQVKDAIRALLDEPSVEAANAPVAGAR